MRGNAENQMSGELRSENWGGLLGGGAGLVREWRFAIFALTTTSGRQKGLAYDIYEE